MLEIWRRAVVASAVAVYLVGLGCAGGMLLDRLRSDVEPPMAPPRHIEAGPQAATGGETRP
jgi:hypothetical protein